MSKQWVLVRGMLSEEFHWDHFTPSIENHFPDHSLHFADFIGNGKTHHLPTPLEIQSNIDSLRAQAPAEGKKILLGFSLGGMLAVEWAYAHPEEVEAIVLINTSLGNSPFYRRMTFTAFKHFIFSSLVRDPHKREAHVLRMTTRGLSDAQIQSIAEKWGARNAQYPPRASNFLRQLYVAAHVPYRPTPPPVPLLILTSAQDRVVHPSCSFKIAETWKAPMVIHPTAGHDMTLEDPRWVLENIENWLSQENILKASQPSIDRDSPVTGEFV